MWPLAVVRSGGLLLSGLLICGVSITHAECIDYANYVQSIVGVDTPGLAWDMVVWDGHAYIADGPAGLTIVDVSDLSDMSVVSNLNVGEAAALAVRGRWAYVAANYSQFEVFDISDPSHPELAGYAPWNWSAGRVAVSGDYAFAACGYDGLRVLDISVPSHPRIVGRVGTVRAGDVVLGGSLAYVTGSDSLTIFDISDPLHASRVGAVSIPNGCLAVKGSYAYVAVPYQGLWAVNVGVPSHPSIVGHSSEWGEFVRTVTVDGTNAYLSGGVLWRFDISDPRNPVALGMIDLPSGPARTVIQDGRAFVADLDAGLMVADLTCWDHIQPLGEVQAPDQGIGVALDGGYAYLAAFNHGLQVVDVSDPHDPRIVGSVDTPGIAEKVAVGNGCAYVTDFESGLQVISIENPNSPYVAGSLDFPDRARDVAAAGSLVAVAAGSFYLVDASLPGTPRILSNMPIPAEQVDIAGPYAYVAESNFHVVDISNPDQPQVVGTLDGVGGDDMRIQGDYAYLVGTALCVVDIRDPANPRLAAQVDLHGWSKGISLRGPIAYIAGARMGLVAFDITKPRAPALLGTADIETTQDVTATDEYVCVAYSGGLVLYPTQCQTAGLSQAAGRASEITLQVSPNPASRQATIHVGLAATGPVRVDVVDVAGRRVRRLWEGVGASGPWSFGWDGRDGDGRALPRGVYSIRVVAGDEARTVQLTLLD